MNNPFADFKKIIDDTKSAGTTFNYLSNVVKPPYDYSDLLRWQLAQSVSALDKLIHDLVRIGMLEIYQDKRRSTPKYESFTITLGVLKKMKDEPSQELSYLEEQIILTNGYKAFQDPDKISESLSLIWNESQKWDRIASSLGRTAADVKTQLKNIVIRRNQIVHEGDYAGFSSLRDNIDEADVVTTIDFIEKLGKAIYDHVKS